jgi:alpha-tubulin suppressor-like RCC1 family protein
MGCQSGYKFPFDGYSADFDDVFVRKEFFSEGGLWVWGTSATGVGDNAVVNRSSPVQTVSGGTNWKSVSIKNIHTGIKSDGTLWLWGSGAAGRLGNNSTASVSSPVQTVSGGTNWKQVSTAIDNGWASAIKTDGTLWMWGQNSQGQLGDNSVVLKSSPVQTVSGGTNWKCVEIGESTSLAIKTDGTLWVWGDGSSGKLGTNDTVDRSSPVQTISGGTNWKEITNTRESSAAIKTDGTLWVWGAGSGGRLGTDDTVDRSSPVQTVSGGTNWKQVSGGCTHVSAIKTDGTLWLWGTGSGGRIGDNLGVSQSSPVQTVSGGTNWKYVSSGHLHTAAIKTDGSLWLWGCGANGQIGLNSTISYSSPVQTISGGTNWIKIVAGTCTTGAIREDCW